MENSTAQLSACSQEGTEFLIEFGHAHLSQGQEPNAGQAGKGKIRLLDKACLAHVVQDWEHVSVNPQRTAPTPAPGTEDRLPQATQELVLKQQPTPQPAPPTNPALAQVSDTHPVLFHPSLQLQQEQPQQRMMATLFPAAPETPWPNWLFALEGHIG